MFGKCEIKKMEASHIDDVVYVEEMCFSIPWTKSDFDRELHANSLAHYFVAIFDSHVVGYSGMWHVITEGHITNLAVLEEYRNFGIGGMLLDSMILLAKEKMMIGLTLEVRMSNIAAQRLYTGRGFKPEGFRKRYYSDTGEDAVIMWLYF